MWMKLYPKNLTFKARYEDGGFCFYDTLSKVKTVASEETPYVIWFGGECYRSFSESWFLQHCTGEVVKGEFYSICNLNRNVGIWIEKDGNTYKMCEDKNGNPDEDTIQIIGEDLFRLMFIC